MHFIYRDEIKVYFRCWNGLMFQQFCIQHGKHWRIYWERIDTHRPRPSTAILAASFDSTRDSLSMDTHINIDLNRVRDFGCGYFEWFWWTIFDIISRFNSNLFWFLCRRVGRICTILLHRYPILSYSAEYENLNFVLKIGFKITPTNCRGLS